MNRAPSARGWLVAALLLRVAAGSALAHSPDGITQNTRLIFDPSALRVEYDTTFGEISAAAQLIAADTDWDGKLSPAETEAYLQASAAGLITNLTVRLGDAPVPLAYETGGSVKSTTRYLTRSVRLRGDIGTPGPGTNVVTVRDANPPPSSIEHIAYDIEARPGARTLHAAVKEGRLEWRVLTQAGLPGDVADSSAPPPAALVVAKPEGAGDGAGGRPASSAAGAGEADRLAGFVRRAELTPGVVMLALLLAAGLGALHALSPGHGKSLVAAYLVGARGTVRHAVILGAIVTMTHVGSVLLVGVLALALTSRFLPEQVFPWLGCGSGVLVFGVGVWMLARRALGMEDHHHHHHDHDHEHGHHHGAHEPHTHEHPHDERGALLRNPARARPAGDVTWGSLLSLGIAGGMVPCPSALVVLLTAIAFRRLAFGLALILAFSAGLAAVLVAIGVLTVKAGRLLGGAQGERASRWLQVLPVISAVLIMLAGAGIAIHALISGGVLRFM